jgi:hypothetical protein
MKDTYKHHHTSFQNMNALSTTSRLDCIDERIKKIQNEISGFNVMLVKRLDVKLEEKLIKFQ